MANIFSLENISDFSEKLNMDELYEKKKQHDISTTNNYKTILNRIHNRIKTTSRQQLGEQYCWFVVPEMMIGVPKYDQAKCISYVIDKLQVNGFRVRYTHPNLLFISWQHWVPDYVRAEIKKKTGLNIDGYGNIKNEEDEEKSITPNSLFNKLTTSNTTNTTVNKNVKDIDTYKPSGNLIYNTDIINSLKNNFKK